MAHQVLYKRPAEISTYEFDFTDLLPLDANLDQTKSYVKVEDSAGKDQTGYFVQKISYNELTLDKKATVQMANGLNGEDYLVYFYGVGNMTLGVPTPNRILEMRCRSKIAGNL